MTSKRLIGGRALGFLVALVATLIWISPGAHAADAPPTEPGTFLLEITTGRLLKVGSHAVVAWAPDSKTVAVADAPPEGGNSRLRLITLASGVERSVTLTEAGSINTVRWSPDGARVAFTLARGGRDPGPSLSIVTAATASVQQLNRGSVGDIAWNPDGKSLAVQLMDDKGGSVVTMDAADGKVLKTVLSGNDAMCQRGLAWSADGTRLAYTSPGLHEGCGDDTSNWGVWIWDAGSGNARHAFSGAADVPRWLTNGDLVAVVNTPGDASTRTWSLLRFDAAGGGPKPIDDTIPPMFPQPSSLTDVAGNVVLYPVSTCDVGAAYLWTAGQTTPNRVTPPDTFAYSPALAPDGKRVAYVRIGDTNDLVVAPIGDGDPTVVTSLTGLGLHIGTNGAWGPAGDWSPDSAWIAVEVTDEQYKDCIEMS